MAEEKALDPAKAFMHMMLSLPEPLLDIRAGALATDSAILTQSLLHAQFVRLARLVQQTRTLGELGCDADLSRLDRQLACQIYNLIGLPSRQRHGAGHDASSLIQS